VTPFARGGFILGLHAQSSLSAVRQAELLVEQAVAAEAAGFDGVTISEHHAGFPGYVPQPLLVATWVLGATERIWAGPGPLLLGPRTPTLVAEELAWTAARFPSRFGAVLAPGYAASDFAALGLPPERMRGFATQLPELLAALRADGPLGSDAAVAGWSAAPAPLLVAANGPKAVRRAADNGVGIMFGGGLTADELGGVARTYRGHGGTGPVLGLRPMWLGEPPVTEESAAAARAYAAIGAATKGGAPTTGDAGRVVDEVAAWMAAAEVDCLNVRLHVPGVAAEVTAEQIARVGAEVLPVLRERFGSRAAGASGAGVRS
jgi:alkanesulfonate monooxygenase SsuD/methylene tetrahydromethanopterin reductase-like flavin-dependent oxidoreductase (luciferase family)